MHRPGLLMLSLTLAAALAGILPESRAASAPRTGKAIYDFYCYQCHAYAGDARTLASTFLEPPPRNFTTADPDTLTRERMIDAVTNGRPGTAMVSFSSVASQAEIEAVVDFIRAELMQAKETPPVYHTAGNGWDNHERYRAAFPFANGEIPLDTAWEDLGPQQQEGKRLFLGACISCHDRASVRDEGAIWELRALSYPRRHYSHAQPVDGLSGASPYALHDRLPAAMGMTASQRRGEALYQENCAFCHAADGTAKNWIGSFLEPRPRDLTGQSITGRDDHQLREIILQGLPGTSMPAWRHVLDANQIDDILAYVRGVLARAEPATGQ
jgi:cytochrome c oxidase cbb3-type subunit 3